MNDPAHTATEPRFEQAMEWLAKYHPRLASKLRAEWRGEYDTVEARLEQALEWLAKYHPRLAQKLRAEWRAEDAAAAARLAAEALDEAEEQAAQLRARQARDATVARERDAAFERTVEQERIQHKKASPPSLWSRMRANWRRYWQID